MHSVFEARKSGPTRPRGEMSEPPVDLTHLHEVADGDTVFEQELVDLFLSDVGDRVSAIAEGLQEANGEKVRRESHSLKGAAANMGAKPLKQAAADLEEAAREGDLRDAPRLLARIAHEIERARKVLENRSCGGL